MDIYEVGTIVGKILSIIGGVLIIWFIIKIPSLIKYGFKKIFPNPAKENIQIYLFWSNFVQGIKSTSEFRKKLKTKKAIKVYKGKFNEFYLTKEEALVQSSEVVETITIKEVLKSETYPLFLLERLKRITLYDKKDLKNITRNSSLVWGNILDIWVHFILRNDKIIYPNDYNKSNEFRFGYIVLHGSDGLKGIYDIEEEKLEVAIKYQNIELLANLAIMTLDNNTEMILTNLDTKMTLEISKKLTMNTIKEEFLEELNLSKIELKEYIKLFPTLKTKYDLERVGLWAAKVGVMEVPSVYEEILEDKSSGVIMWNDYCSADIFDMSVELPVNFKKKNGEYVSVGIELKYLILEKKYREKLKDVKGLSVNKEENKTEDTVNNIKDFKDLLKRGNLPDDDRDVPMWLQIKNETYKTIPTTKEIIADIVALENDEFMQFMNRTINQNVFFTALTQAKDEELKILYTFLENGAEGLSLQFKEQIAKFKEKDIQKEQLNFALMVVSLYPLESKKTLQQYLRLNQDMNKLNFTKGDEGLHELEYSMNSILFHSTDDMNIKLKELISLIKKLFEEDKIKDDFCLHIASKFSPLLLSIDKIKLLESTSLERDLKWFIDKFITEDIDILQDDSILHQLILLNKLRIDAILEEKQDIYLEHTITISRYLMAFYPYLKTSGLFYLDDILNFVAHKEITVQNANDFLEIFEVLPAFYTDTNYENILEFKEFINKRLATWKPQNNKIFNEDGVKSKMILLNYLVDMEDLYYESGEDNLK